MPQLQLEYSTNVIEKNNFQDLFKDCHHLLATALPTNIDSCKSRAVECATYYVGNGHMNNTFVHTTLKVMPGRTPDTLKKIGEQLMDVLKSYFRESLDRLNLQITLEIIELQNHYFKIAS